MARKKNYGGVCVCVLVIRTCTAYIFRKFVVTLFIIFVFSADTKIILTDWYPDWDSVCYNNGDILAILGFWGVGLIVLVGLLCLCENICSMNSVAFDDRT